MKTKATRDILREIFYDDSTNIQYDESEDLWEVIFMDTDKNGDAWIELSELKKLNSKGVVHIGEATGIDYEDGLDESTDMLYMDILYFQQLEVPTNLQS
jgi:hypothetical protein